MDASAPGTVKGMTEGGCSPWCVGGLLYASEVLGVPGDCPLVETSLFELKCDNLDFRFIATPDIIPVIPVALDFSGRGICGDAVCLELSGFPEKIQSYLFHPLIKTQSIFYL